MLCSLAEESRVSTLINIPWTLAKESSTWSAWACNKVSPVCFWLAALAFCLWIPALPRPAPLQATPWMAHEIGHILQLKALPTSSLLSGFVCGGPWTHCSPSGFTTYSSSCLAGPPSRTTLSSGFRLRFHIRRIHPTLRTFAAGSFCFFAKYFPFSEKARTSTRTRTVWPVLGDR